MYRRRDEDACPCFRVHDERAVFINFRDLAGDTEALAEPPKKLDG